MNRSLFLPVVVALALGFAGCNKASSDDYAAKTQPVINALEQLRADGASATPAVLKQHVGDADQAAKAWEDALSAEQKNRESAKLLKVALAGFRTVADTVGSAPAVSDAAKKSANDATQYLDQAKQKLSEGK